MHVHIWVCSHNFLIRRWSEKGTKDIARERVVMPDTV